MKRILILLSVFGLLLGACGGGDDDKSSNASTDDKTETASDDDSSGDDSGDDSSSDGELKAKLLAVGDLPAGFKLTDSDEKDPSTSDDEEDQDFCPELSNLDKDYPGEREAEASFERTSGTGGASINQQIKRYKDDDEADDAFSAFESGFGKCKTFSETDEEDGTTLTGSFEKTDFAKAGDDTYGTILTMKQSGGGQSIELKGNFVALREGKYIILVMAVAFGDEVTKAELEGIAKTAVGKV